MSEPQPVPAQYSALSTQYSAPTQPSYLAGLRCFRCGATYPPGPPWGGCPACARAGLDAYLFTTEQFPPTMRAFMQAYGAKVFVVPTAADRLTMVRRGVEERGWVPIQNYLMPPVGAPAYMLDGAKTVGFELAEQLDWRVPDVVVAPTSNGDLPVGVWRAFLELRELGWVDRVPRMVAAEGYGGLANALAE